MKKAILSFILMCIAGISGADAQTRLRLCFVNGTACEITICLKAVQVCDPECGSNVPYDIPCTVIPNDNLIHCIEDPVIPGPPNPFCPSQVCYGKVIEMRVIINGVSTTLMGSTLENGAPIFLPNCEGVMMQWDASTQRWYFMP
jgi:hypothetical protein